MLRVLWIFFLAISAGSVLGLAALIWFYPVLGAGVCPRCFGLQRAAPGLYVEPGMTGSARRHVLVSMDTARDRIVDFYSERRAHVRIVACHSERCDRRFGGRGAAAVTYSLGPFAVVRVSPRGLDATVLAHEIAHTEAHARLGFVGHVTRKMPAWFDEGLSVVVSDDPRYLAPGTGSERCKVTPAADLPASPFDWAPRAARDPSLYAQAACAVLLWAEAQGEAGAVHTRLATGARFP